MSEGKELDKSCPCPCGDVDLPPPPPLMRYRGTEEDNQRVALAGKATRSSQLNTNPEFQSDQSLLPEYYNEYGGEGESEEEEEEECELVEPPKEDVGLGLDQCETIIRKSKKRYNLVDEYLRIKAELKFEEKKNAYLQDRIYKTSVRKGIINEAALKKDEAKVKQRTDMIRTLIRKRLLAVKTMKRRRKQKLVIRGLFKWTDPKHRTPEFYERMKERRRRWKLKLKERRKARKKILSQHRIEMRQEKEKLLKEIQRQKELTKRKKQLALVSGLPDDLYDYDDDDQNIVLSSQKRGRKYNHRHRHRRGKSSVKDKKDKKNKKGNVNDGKIHEKVTKNGKVCRQEVIGDKTDEGKAKETKEHTGNKSNQANKVPATGKGKDSKKGDKIPKTAETKAPKFGKKSDAKAPPPPSSAKKISIEDVEYKRIGDPQAQFLLRGHGKLGDRINNELKYEKLITQIMRHIRKEKKYQFYHDTNMLRQMCKRDLWKKANEQMLQELISTIKEYSNKAVDSNTGYRIPHEETEQFCREIMVVHSKLCTTMMSMFKSRRGLELSLQRLEASEVEGEGLQMLEYEQLRSENQALKDRLGDRMKDVENIQAKITHAIQILAHFRNKMFSMNQYILEGKEQLNQVNVEVHASRERTERIIKRHEIVKKEEQALVVESGLLENSTLLRDYEKTHFHVLDLKEQKRKLLHDLDAYNAEIKEIKRRINEMKTYYPDIYEKHIALERARLQEQRKKQGRFKRCTASASTKASEVTKSSSSPVETAADTIIKSSSGKINTLSREHILRKISTSFEEE